MYSPNRGYNYSNLMLTNFIGSSYMSDVFANNATYIELYMGSVVGVVCVFLLGVHRGVVGAGRCGEGGAVIAICKCE